MTMSASQVLARTNLTGAIGSIGPELCWEALESNTLGRLAVVLDGKIHIFPINYAVDGTRIYFRTAAGSKLFALRTHPEVALEIDAVDDEAAYSVVVKGLAAWVESPDEVAIADALPLRAWIPTLKLRWVRIWAAEVTGRAFRRGAEPLPYV
ncbi:MAG TPA: pyridoxamine 5'-phosphate oxidase family protein [Candidatus Lumbricidophila sp.]|nr:pyridoxamine 5'-phosphate oxidase family protein [Candidatus Lumbricidophila sp.]